MHILTALWIRLNTKKRRKNAHIYEHKQTRQAFRLWESLTIYAYPIDGYIHQ